MFSIGLGRLRVGWEGRRIVRFEGSRGRLGGRTHAHLGLLFGEVILGSSPGLELLWVGRELGSHVWLGRVLASGRILLGSFVSCVLGVFAAMCEVEGIWMAGKYHLGCFDVSLSV